MHEEDPTGVSAVLPGRFWKSFQQNPYRYYRFLRGRQVWDYQEAYGAVLATGYEACEHVLRSPAFGMGDLRAWLSLLPFKYDEEAVDAIERQMRSMMLFRNADDHALLRATVARAAGAQNAALSFAGARAVSDRLLQEHSREDEIDLMDAFARAVPFELMASELGIPSEDRADLRALCFESTPFLGHGMTPSVLVATSRALLELRGRLEALAEARRKNPGDDLLSRLLRRQKEGALTGEEVVGHALFILTAGLLTTASLLGNGLRALIEHPTQLRVLQADRRLLPQAVEELGRFDSPVQITGRTALEDTVVAGHVVRRGTRVLVAMGAANRDHRRFPRPGRLDVSRRGPTNLVFGTGAHFCLGAPYARILAQAAVGSFADHVVRVRLAERPQVVPSVTIRGPRSLRASIRWKASNAHG